MDITKRLLGEIVEMEYYRKHGYNNEYHSGYLYGLKCAYQTVTDMQDIPATYFRNDGTLSLFSVLVLPKIMMNLWNTFMARIPLTMMVKSTSGSTTNERGNYANRGREKHVLFFCLCVRINDIDFSIDLCERISLEKLCRPRFSL